MEFLSAIHSKQKRLLNRRQKKHLKVNSKVTAQCTGSESGELSHSMALEHEGSGSSCGRDELVQHHFVQVPMPLFPMTSAMAMRRGGQRLGVKLCPPLCSSVFPFQCFLSMTERKSSTLQCIMFCLTTDTDSQSPVTMNRTF